MGAYRWAGRWACRTSTCRSPGGGLDLASVRVRLRLGEANPNPDPDPNQAMGLGGLPQTVLATGAVIIHIGSVLAPSSDKREPLSTPA